MMHVDSIPWFVVLILAHAEAAAASTIRQLNPPPRTPASPDPSRRRQSGYGAAGVIFKNSNIYPS